jgi:hypothetical protein
MADTQTNRTCVLVCPCCPCLKVWTDYLSKVIPLSGKFHAAHKKLIQSNHKTVWPLACDVNHIRQFPSAPLLKNDVVCRRGKLSGWRLHYFCYFRFSPFITRLLYKKDNLCKDTSCLIIYQLLQVIYRQSGSNVKKTLEDLMIRRLPSFW